MKNPFNIDHLARTLPRFQKPTLQIPIPQRNEVPHEGIGTHWVDSLARAETRFYAGQIQRGSSLLANGGHAQNAFDHQDMAVAANEHPGLLRKQPEFFKPTPMPKFEPPRFTNEMRPSFTVVRWSSVLSFFSQRTVQKR